MFSCLNRAFLTRAPQSSNTPLNGSDPSLSQISNSINYSQLFQQKFNEMNQRLDGEFRSATEACNSLSYIPIVSIYSGSMRIPISALQTLKGVALLGVAYFGNFENSQLNEITKSNGINNIKLGAINLGRGLIDISQLQYPLKLFICCLNYLIFNSQSPIDSLRQFSISDQKKNLMDGYSKTKEGLESIANICKVFSHVGVIGSVFALPLLTMVGMLQVVAGSVEKIASLALNNFRDSQEVESTGQEKGRNFLEKGVCNIGRVILQSVFPILTGPVFLAHDIGSFLAPEETARTTDKIFKLVLIKTREFYPNSRGFAEEAVGGLDQEGSYAFEYDTG